MIVAIAVLLAGSLSAQTPEAPASAAPPDSSLWTTTETVVALGTVAGTLAWMPFDQDANSWASSHHSPASRGWAAGAKALGDGYITLPVSGALWLVGAKCEMPRLARASKNALESWLLTEVLVTGAKYGFHRSRPSESGSNQEWGGPGFSSSHLSFPSGHSASAWGLLPAYALEFSDQPWVVGGVYLAAASTSLSRVHDGQHWMSDVFFSAGTGYLVNRLVRSWNLQRSGSVAVMPLVAPGIQGVSLVSRF